MNAIKILTLNPLRPNFFWAHQPPLGPEFYFGHMQQPELTEHFPKWHELKYWILDPLVIKIVKFFLFFFKFSKIYCYYFPLVSV
jgi:hypothetical protein